MLETTKQEQAREKVRESLKAMGKDPDKLMPQSKKPPVTLPAGDSRTPEEKRPRMKML